MSLPRCVHPAGRDWTSLDWSFLTCRERGYIRALISRRAYLAKQPERFNGMHSYHFDELVAIDWALGLIIDAAAKKTDEA